MRVATIFMQAALLLVSLLMAGCGPGNNPRAVNVSGTVTFNGKPVPLGVIYFDPDTSAGNDGVQGSANIRNGSYDTSQTGKGITGGAYTVRIRGADAQSDDPERPSRPLFGEYSIKVEFPYETTTKDFEVPTSAAKNLKSVPARVP